MTTALTRPEYETDIDVIENPPTERGMIDVAQTRAAQEVQAAMVVAKKFPRDETAALTRIINACKRPSLAEQSQYTYPRGNKTVNGPSIRIAEVCAQNWGNIDFGVVELEQRRRESDVMAYAWDLETNARQTKVFTIKHERHTRQGSYPLTDPRDIYEMTANQGARRVRACILGIIPGDIIEAAVKQCDKTMAGDNKGPIIDRVRSMVQTFTEYGVNQEMIENRLGHKVDTISETELVALRKIYTTIRDNMATKDQFFPQTPSSSNGKTKAQAIVDRAKEKTAQPEPAPPELPEGEREIPLVKLSEIAGLNIREPFQTNGTVASVRGNKVNIFAGANQKEFFFEGERPAWVKKDVRIIITQAVRLDEGFMIISCKQ